MSDNSASIVSKVWNYAHVLKNAGVDHSSSSFANCRGVEGRADCDPGAGGGGEEEQNGESGDPAEGGEDAGVR